MLQEDTLWSQILPCSSALLVIEYGHFSIADSFHPLAIVALCDVCSETSVVSNL